MYKCYYGRCRLKFSCVVRKEDENLIINFELNARGRIISVKNRIKVLQAERWKRRFRVEIREAVIERIERMWLRRMS